MVVRQILYKFVLLFSRKFKSNNLEKHCDPKDIVTASIGFTLVSQKCHVVVVSLSCRCRVAKSTFFYLSIVSTICDTRTTRQLHDMAISLWAPPTTTTFLRHNCERCVITQRRVYKKFWTFWQLYKIYQGAKFHIDRSRIQENRKINLPILGDLWNLKFSLS